MTCDREPPAYPGDPYNDPDYDEVAILKGEVERLQAEKAELSRCLNGKTLPPYMRELIDARAEVERLTAERDTLKSEAINLRFRISELEFQREAALERKP